jgi:pyruvate dehydrogenase E2 component (dihydrolipoamide acetyltransferase)
MVEVIMPKMGDGMEEGTLVDWTVQEGAKVKSGDIIGNIQTDKATVELPAPSSGVFAGALIKAGDTVPVGQAIGAILKEGEKLPEGWGNGSSAPPAAKPTPAQPEPAPEAARAPQPAPAAPVSAGGRVLASPLARKVAREAGIAIEMLRGSGPEGRIVERDVQAAIASGSPNSGAQPSLAPPPVVGAGLSDRVVDLTNLQRITAERTAHAKSYVPHYYVTVEVDLENLEAIRNQFNEDDPENKLSINDFIIKACSLALIEQPHINASFESGKRHEHGAVNIGVAAAVPQGLTVPVLRNCESKSLRQIATEVRALVAKARENKLGLDEVTGSTFSISNMGMFDVENFSAIINEPNGAILAVSTARRVPVVVNDTSDTNEHGESLEIRTRMKVTGSFDHRIIDGAVGAAFMGVLKKYLEHPTLLLN